MPRKLTPLEKRWIRVEVEFRRDVIVCTRCLLFQIDAIHSLHRRARELQATAGNNTEPLPVYPPLRGRPFVVGVPLSQQAAPDGPMEAAAFRSWVVEVYWLWETRHRVAHERAARPDVPDAIQPEVAPLGDLRRVRNNMLHGGVATKDNAAGCKVLRWFKEGEHIQVRLRHVLDFLNQMGWLTEGPILVSGPPDVQAIGWHVNRDDWDGRIPTLVSARPMLDTNAENPIYRYGASIVFEDGVHGCVPFVPPSETPEETERMSRLWPAMTVTDDGDLVVPGLGVEISAARLYRSLMKGERQAGPMWGPAMRFSK
ncbi:MAG: hypothetical protein F4W89_16700 [Acidobacteria bacterium]|nr:hypothetical protein [Acidobacteriota bacterium]